MKLAGQKALVTGASRGIGRVIALTLAREGADVALAARSVDALERVAEEVRSLGRQAWVVPTDLTREDQVQRLAETALAACGQLDLVVNNAAAFAGGPVVQMATTDWDRVLATNLRGPFLLSRAVLPAMIRRQSGTLVMISSTSGKRADPGGAAYSASKFGLMGLAQALLYEVRSYNIRVVVITPSAVDTRPLPPPEQVPGGPGVRMRAEDLAESVLLAVSLPPRALIREIEVWGTNPG